MKKRILAAAIAMFAASGLQAQDTAPDGTDALGFEPYVGIQGGYEDDLSSAD